MLSGEQPGRSALGQSAALQAVSVASLPFPQGAELLLSRGASALLEDVEGNTAKSLGLAGRPNHDI